MLQMKIRKRFIEGGSERAKVLLLTRNWGSQSPSPCWNWAHTDVHKPLPAAASLRFSPFWLWTWHSCWPRLWSGLLERALVTGAGTGESRSVWLRRTALAQGLISGPSTLPTLSTQAHTRTHTCKVKHCPLCPHSAAVTRPARFGG